MKKITMDITPWLPRYHFIAPQKMCWAFDPNGAIFWKGRWHLFYLFSDSENPYERLCWGHASSENLVEWVFHKPALMVDRPGEKGMYSGCALVTKEGRPALAYYSYLSGICLAFPEDGDDMLLTWHKYEGNPVLDCVTDDDPRSRVYGVFDPHVWLDESDGNYYAIIGGKNKPGVEYDPCFLFRSPDLFHWEYLRPFYQITDHYVHKFDDLSCPDFFKVDEGKYALLGISHIMGARYYLGSLIQHTFVPESHHLLNYPGGTLFAPESAKDDSGRRISWFWMVTDLADVDLSYQIREIMALPRELRYSPEYGKLLCFVPKELDFLFGAAQKWENPQLIQGGMVEIPFRSRSCKIELEFRGRAVPTSDPCQNRVSLKLLADAQGEQCLELIIDQDSRQIVLEYGKSTIPMKCVGAPGAAGTPYENNGFRQIIPWEGSAHYTMNIYLDNRIVEVFSPDGRFAASQLIFNGPDCDRMFFCADPQAKGEIESFIVREARQLEMIY